MELDTEKTGNGFLPATETDAEINALKERLLTEHKRNLFLREEFNNYRLRREKEGNAIIEEGKREFLLPLLAIVDDLEQRRKHISAMDTPAGQELLYLHEKLLAMLGMQGVVPFDSVGQPFDHRFHEALSTTTHDEWSSGTIVEEVRRGYLWNSALLRSAQVRVVAW